MKDKTKKNIKDTIKDLIALVFIVGLIFGGYKLFQNYKSNQINGQDSYKIKTERDNKYDGVYSLTKLDEKGNNTWDGLMLYVKKDKIVSCTKFEYTPIEEIKKQFGDKVSQIDGENDIFWQAEELGVKLDLPRGVQMVLETGFVKGSLSSIYNPVTSFLTTQGEFVCKDKIDFERVTDIKTDYDYMQSCGLVPAYDEENKEVWLSKLLSNEKSEYHDGYKLIKYKGYDDIQKNCKLDNGSCLENLNKEFNARL